MVAVMLTMEANTVSAPSRKTEHEDTPTFSAFVFELTHERPLEIAVTDPVGEKPTVVNGYDNGTPFNMAVLTSSFRLEYPTRNKFDGSPM